jgi:hypothetical protein
MHAGVQLRDRQLLGKGRSRGESDQAKQAHE